MSFVQRATDCRLSHVLEPRIFIISSNKFLLSREARDYFIVSHTNNELCVSVSVGMIISKAIKRKEDFWKIVKWDSRGLLEC